MARGVRVTKKTVSAGEHHREQQRHGARGRVQEAAGAQQRFELGGMFDDAGRLPLEGRGADVGRAERKASQNDDAVGEARGCRGPRRASRGRR
jgi:hypothetical protein